MIDTGKEIRAVNRLYSFVGVYITDSLIDRLSNTN